MLFSLQELEVIAQELEQGDPDADLIDTDLSKGKRRRRNGKLPADLPREIVRHELAPAQRQCPCCGHERHEVGVESSEQLELIPSLLKVIQHDRVKYACRNCQADGISGNVTIADKPPQPIEKGLPAAGLCAYTVLSKFGDHSRCTAPKTLLRGLAIRFAAAPCVVGRPSWRSLLCRWCCE